MSFYEGSDGATQNLLANGSALANGRVRMGGHQPADVPKGETKGVLS